MTLSMLNWKNTGELLVDRAHPLVGSNQQHGIAGGVKDSAGLATRLLRRQILMFPRRFGSLPVTIRMVQGPSSAYDQRDEEDNAGQVHERDGDSRVIHSCPPALQRPTSPARPAR